MISKHLTPEEYRNLKILCVFGNTSVIYVTIDDKVYDFGNNESGCLGLGADNKNIHRPKLNPYLSGKCLTDIQYGYLFCIGLTANGRCYSWGVNDCGQLGVGIADKHSVPQLIGGELADKRVTRMCVSNCFALVLTECDRVYGWGRNTFCQLGVRTVDNKFQPVLIQFGHKIADILCGKTHSIALTETGRLYTWGNNRYGQTGREVRIWDKTGLSEIVSSPKLLDFNPVVRKVVCGSDHSLLLTTDGEVYAFGFNSDGQVGNGTTNTQCLPIKVSDQIRFKDIMTNTTGNISAAIAVDDEYYIWGECKGKRILSPQKVDKNGKWDQIVRQNVKRFLVITRHGDQLIYGHKLILKIRNKKFWHKCEHYMDADGKEIRVKHADIVDQLLTLANIYGEESLASLCSQFMIQTIDVFNVCQLYAKALELKCEELETKCYDFMAQNMKDICLTQEFLEFDGELAKQLINNAFIAGSNSV
ncbi:unnamed protein product [Medioppia subpectinata]|uniref:RCC1 and BTB domain-containing protein 1 n=1 Tax=Medioppia subpectinata TaxID=1979941 RepID=A0A7R9PYT1_9ACAR|nr:unnamed protein product [Medioppia subpectinata]CAG2105444.1 unnamed protein product [Medioppia subpectinata]